MNSVATSKTREQVRVDSASEIDAFSKGSIAVMAGVSATIGIWAALCFAGALFNDGPFALIKGALTALTGI